MLRARTAERYGLVHDVVADASALDARVVARAELLAGHAPTALGLAKVLVQASGEANSATSFRLEGAFQQTLLGQSDLAQRFPAALAFIKAQMANPE
jgi:enoyl-CoA hydratase/carnithine racemase